MRLLVPGRLAAHLFSDFTDGIGVNQRILEVTHFLEFGRKFENEGRTHQKLVQAQTYSSEIEISREEEFLTKEIY